MISKIIYTVTLGVLLLPLLAACGRETNPAPMPSPTCNPRPGDRLLVNPCLLR